jgi:cytochrome c5
MGGDSSMRRQIIAAVCLAAVGFTLAIMASSLDAFAQKKATRGKEAAEAQVAQGRKVYTTIKDLMDSIVDPSADVVWGAVGTVVDQDGAHETFPKTQEGWLNVRRAAIRIVEGANLLMMSGREAAPPGSKSEAPGVELEPPEITVLIRKKRTSFDAFARALQAVGAEAVRASDAQDTAALLDIGGRMQDVCESCHQTFWYPGAKQPGAVRIQYPDKK